MAQLLDDTLIAGMEAHAVDIARGAGAILSDRFGKPLAVEYKDKRKSDPVTAVDRECQEFLTRAIAERYPDHGILGEEDEAEHDDRPAPEFVWVLDPLDGTKNFIGGLPAYASSVGVMYRGAPIIGAVFIPWPCDAGGAVLHARIGGGAFMDREPLSVARLDEPGAGALVTLPGSFRAAYRFRRPMRGKVGEVRVTGSIAYELAMTARGVLQYCATTGPRLWDVAGGAVLVTEAGGLVMRGHRATGLTATFATTQWEPLDTFLPAWRTGQTTMTELRRWSMPLVLGSPGVVRFVTSNLRNRPRLRHRLARAAGRLRRSRNQ